MSNLVESSAALQIAYSDQALKRINEWFDSDENRTRLISSVSSSAVFDQKATLANDPDIRQVLRLINNWSGPCQEITSNSNGILAEFQTRGYWDFRLGAERDSIPRHASLLPKDLETLVLSLASDWNMQRSEEPKGHFDVVIPIGGLVRANIGRPKSVAKWLRDGLSSSHVVSLASDRASTLREQELALKINVPERTEQDALKYGTERAFNIHPGSWRTVDDNMLEAGTQDLRVTFAIAPPNSDGKRASTEEALLWLIERLQLPSPCRVLIVSTSIYWVANQISARVALPSDIEVETVGYEEEMAPGPPQQFFPQHYLQELKAAVDAFGRLEVWLSK